VIQAATGSDLVYCKDYEHGVLYSLYFKHENRKQHSTVENLIQELDSMLMKKNMTTRTIFTSLTEAGKVKSFSGYDRHQDHHFCELFNVHAPKLANGKQYQLQDGVAVCNKPQDTDFEFDVVKKRKRMETASEQNDDTCPLALQQFEEFEAHVLDALFNVSQDYQALRLNELLELEEAVQTGTPPTVGLVYVAVSECIKHPKIGATRRSDPAQRMKELSKSVPSPFECRMYVRTKTPFKLESQIHKHFDAHRIKKKGACTEFFNIDPRVICEYLKTQFEVVEPQSQFEVVEPQSISPNAASR
jgi:hypothetical protein